MSKYFAIFKTQILTYFAYRLSFVLWRVRNIFNFIIVYFLWSSVFSFRKILFHYSEEKMLTYILITSVLGALVFSTRTSDISGYIVNGDIINYLLKPMSFFSITLTREVTDKMLNGLFAVVEILFFILLLHPPFFIQTNFVSFLFFTVALIIGMAIAFLISFSLSLIAFWTSEIWAPRFIYLILISVLAGTTFPLDILPEKLYSVLLFTPFPYLLYLPAKIYLEGISAQYIPLFLIGIIWITVLFLFTRHIWNKGMKEFSFYGR